MIPLWCKDLCKALIKTFTTLFVIFYTLFLLVDLSTHGLVLLKKQATIAELFYYFAHQSILYIDYIVPLCLLIAVITVLVQKNTSHELCSLYMTGLSSKKIMLPFYFLALCTFCSSLAISQWVAPHSFSYIKAFKTAYAKHPKPEALYKAHLPDSTLIYKNKGLSHIEDVFWLKGEKEVWHFKKIKWQEPALGLFAHQFIKKDKNLKLENTFKKIDLPFSKGDCFSISSEQPKSLTFLYKMIMHPKLPSSQKISLSIQLQQKLIRPFFSFIAIFALFPLCSSYQRKKSLFLIYALSLCAFVTFHMMLESLTILVANHIFSTWILWIPVALSFFLFIPSYRKRKKIFFATK